GSSGVLQREAGGVAARPRQGRDHSRTDRVSHRREHDRDDRCRLLCRNSRRGCRRDDDIYLQPDEFGRSLGEALVPSVRPPILDGDGAALNPAKIAQSTHEAGDALAVERTRVGTQKPDGWQLARLLRARRERPRDCRAAKQRDERAAFHSITSSARSRKASGIVRPSAFAVLRFTTRSNLVGWITGRSPGFSPLRIRPTYTPACR